MSKQGQKKGPGEAETLQIAAATPGHVRSLLLKGAQPVLLLGAAASMTSGIPVAELTVERAARWAWCDEQGRAPEDIRVTRSDYYPWLEKQKWFRPGAPLAEQYPVAIANLLGVKRTRRDFFEKLIAPGIQPSAGYRSLVKILNENWIHTVLTTNFDHCVDDARVLESKPHMLCLNQDTGGLCEVQRGPVRASALSPSRISVASMFWRSTMFPRSIRWGYWRSAHSVKAAGNSPWRRS